jgi:hypothetical protein
MSKFLQMPPSPCNVARIIAIEYRALYNPMEQCTNDIIEISDEESRVGNTKKEDTPQ